MDSEEINKYAGVMPSRAVLARLSLFGVDEETRASANAILKALPAMNERERREYLDETWKLAGLPSEEELLQSPIGRQTLEMLKNSKSMSEEIRAEAVAPVGPEPAAVDPVAPPEPAVEPVNEHLQKLAWPPKPTLTPQPPPKIDEPPDWIQHLDRPRITPWVDFDNNAPLE